MSEDTKKHTEQQLEDENYEPITVNIICPPYTSKPSKFQVAVLDVQSINLIFRLNPDFIFFTCYDLISKTGSILEPDHDLTKDLEIIGPKSNKNNTHSKSITITVKHIPYNENSALLHAQVLARIFFSLSSHRQYSDCHQSVVGWIYRAYMTVPPKFDDLIGIFPEKFVNSDLPRPIKKMDISRASALTMKDRVNGILLKLEVTTCENLTFHVFANASGWFSDLHSSSSSNKTYPTLHHLLSSLSQHYSDRIFLIAEKWCSLMSYERHPFTPLNNTSLFVEKKVDSKQKVVDRSRLELLTNVDNGTNNITFSTLTIDDYMDDIKNDISRDVYAYKIERKYAQEAADGVAMIERGTLEPYGDSENFMWKDLFIMSIEYMASLHKDRGGLETANRVLCNEVKSYQQLANIESCLYNNTNIIENHDNNNDINSTCNDHNNVSNTNVNVNNDNANDVNSFNINNANLRVIRTIIIDYFTDRFAAQSVIPGLLTRHSSVVYGYSLLDHQCYLRDADFEVVLGKCARQLGIAASKIKFADSPVYCSSELNGVKSTDGNLYLADFRRVTPRDYNYPDPVKHHGCVIRHEAIQTYAIVSELEKHSEELIALGGDKETLYHYSNNHNNSYNNNNNSSNGNDNNSNNINCSNGKMEPEKIRLLENRRQEIIESAEKPCFDINILTIDSDSKDVPQNIKDLAKFLLDVIIPKFVSEYVMKNNIIVDGQLIVNEMHSRGINVRYLGKIFKLLKEKDEKKANNSSSSIAHKYFLSSLESEMTARSFKVMAREKHADIDTFLLELNLLLGLTPKEKSELSFSQMFNKLCEISKDKFGVVPSIPQKCQIVLILRTVLRSFGISLYGRQTFDSPIIRSDIGSMTPVVKFPFSTNRIFRSYVDLATTFFSNGDFDAAGRLFNVALENSENTVQPFDEGISICYFYLGFIQERKGDFESAFQSCLKSLVIQEKYNDQTSPEIILRYSCLGRFAKESGKPILAFAFADRAANLAAIAMPSHPMIVSEFADAALYAIHFSPETALRYCDEKIKKYCEENSSPFAGGEEITKKNRAVFYNLMAKASIEMSDLKNALKYQRLACSSDESNESYKISCEIISSTIEGA